MATKKLKQNNFKYRYGFQTKAEPIFHTGKGLSEKVVREISMIKKEPAWMLDLRLRALEFFREKPMPKWGVDLSDINFDEIIYYAKSTDKQERSWEEVPEEIKKTFDRLGVPEAERAFFAGVGAQYDSETIYHNIHKELEDQGVIFMDTGSALNKYPAMFKKYFGAIVPANDNKFSALNSAVWSGGSFLYVPKGVKVKMPLQAYFRINSKNFGQFERTLIIADEESEVHYIEGCTAPVYSTNSLHAAVVEIIAKPNAKVRYTTIQNWSNNVYNLVTKRARAEAGATIEWIDGNLGSKATMKYPSVILAGKGARAEIISVALAGRGQIQDTGAKIIHAAPDTFSHIVSKSVSFSGGKTVFRGMVRIEKGAKNSKTKTRCDSLLFGKDATTETYPAIKTEEQDIQAAHEAAVSKINEKELFYMKTRGLSETEAASLIVAGFLEPFAKTLPMDYAIELNRLIEMEMENSIGLTRLSRKPVNP